MSGVGWPQGFKTSCYRIDGAFAFSASSPDGRLAYLGRGDDEAHAERDAWACYCLANDPEHSHDFDPHSRQDGCGWCRTCGVMDTHAFERRRAINYGRYALRHPWPDDCFVQGGDAGLVMRRGGGSYRTAFVEVSPSDPKTFIRGEGATLAAAEDAAWGKLQRILACPGHEFETRGYTNGAGFCRHCGMFASGVFDVAEVGNPCTVCGTKTNWSQVAGAWYCEEHTPSREERRAMRAAARAKNGTSGDSPLDELFDDLDEND